MNGRLVLAIFSAVGALLAVAPSFSQSNPVLVGRVIKVTDGDTVKVQLTSGPINVCFDSSDAPESNQRHGAQANAALANLVADREKSHTLSSAKLELVSYAHNAI